jgi:hypothetical protein
MFGNTIGSKTYLFMGRYKDGSEQYMRWGKKFREEIELLFDPTGFSPITATLKKMGGKAAPVPQFVVQMFTGYALSGFRNEDIAGKEGWERALGIIKTIMKTLLPFSTRTMMDENKEFKWTDIAMPSSKGMTRWKAIDFFEKAIERKDDRMLMEVWQAATRNNLSPFDLFEASLGVLKAQGRRELLSGIKTVEDAQKLMAKTDVAKNKIVIAATIKRMLIENSRKKAGVQLLTVALAELQKERQIGTI